MLAVSRDSGKTWRNMELPGLPGAIESACGCYLPGPPVFTNGSTGFVTVVNSFGNNSQLGTWIETTIDSGRTWSETASRQGIDATGATHLDSSHWLMAEVNPTAIAESVDGGATWRTIASGGLLQDTFVIWVHAFAGSTAVALVQGPGDSESAISALLSTADGGRTWRQLIPG